MIIESAQLLSTAHRLTDNDDHRLCAATHQNHPCSVWVREGKGNYAWLLTMFLELCSIYKEVKHCQHMTFLKRASALLDIPDLPRGSTDHVLAMPDEYKTSDPYTSYQRYLNAKYREWINRDKPLALHWPKGKPSWVA